MLVGAQRNGDLPVRSDRDAERREQKRGAKLAYRVYCGCAAALGYTRSAAFRLQLRKREIFGETLNVKGEKTQRRRIFPQLGDVPDFDVYTAMNLTMNRTQWKGSIPSRRC